jgi:hypothetical protein
MDLEETEWEGVEWINMASDMVSCRYGNGSFRLLKMHGNSFLDEELLPSEGLFPCE